MIRVYLLLLITVLNNKKLFIACSTTVTLNNNKTIPLIGVGLGNLPDDQIPQIVTAAFSDKDGLGYRLIDTSHVSGNERLISDSIANLIKNRQFKPSKNFFIDIVTKVWYTHLGYERTMISLKESMTNIMDPLKRKVNVRIHFLIHWPRCHPDLAEWMRCDEEENELPQYVKDAGNAPSQFSFLSSWRAMEDFYLENQPSVGSIGISNFDNIDLEMLLESCRIKPALYQSNMETIYEVMPVLEANNIYSQVTKLFEVFTRGASQKLEIARSHLITLAADLSTPELTVHPSSVLISFMVSNLIGMIPRTSNVEHLKENSPRNVHNVPSFSTEQNDRMHYIIRSSLFHWHEEGEDPDALDEESPGVHLSFFNKIPDSAIKVFWVDNENEKHEVLEHLSTGDTAYLKSHPGHTFVAYDVESGNEIKKFLVTEDYGYSEWFPVEL